MDVGTIRQVDLDETMRSAYLDYAMSVITARALPDVRDGLKPVQRRILYAMHDMGITANSATKKSARIIGEVLGKYHPHGDTAVYEAMVRMAQDFSMRYPLVEGQGNFGSVDGDGAAAMRYTEARLTALGDEMLKDIDKNSVDFADNFDGSLQEPVVLPAKLPNLLLNGVGGIAVGMATNVPPHNLNELADAICYLIRHYEAIEDVSLGQLMRYVKGPDFPTGGTILGREGIRLAYATGKGRIIVRARAHIENQRGGHTAIIINELPFQVNKANLVERIANLVREDRLEGIADLRDESDRTGMRVVIDLKRGVEPGPLLDGLIKLTQFQTTFGVNMLALVGGEPKRLSLKQVLQKFIEHRREVLERRTQFELDKAEARAHILEGLLKALDQLDEVIATIRRSRTADTARRNLIKHFQFTEVQAQAILDMQLRRLAALERRKIEDEYAEITKRIAYLKGLLASKAAILGLIVEELGELKKAYGDGRRTAIADVDDTASCDPEDLMPNEAAYIVYTRSGSVRRWPQKVAASNSGIPGMSLREKDVLAGVLMAQSQEGVTFFTDHGRAFHLLTHQLPDGEQQATGLPFRQLAPLDQGEGVIGALVLEGQEGHLCLCTRQGKVKRLALAELSQLGRAPTTVIGLADDDRLGWVCLGCGDDLILVCAGGKAIRIAEDTIRPQGLSATGVRGITLKGTDALVAMCQARESGQLLVATAVGYGKRTMLKEYPTQGRGGQGVATVDSAKQSGTGDLVAALVVSDDDDVVLTTAAGAMKRVAVADVPRLGRATWGRVVTRTRRNALIEIENDQVSGLVRLLGDAPDKDGSTPEEPPPPKRPSSRSRSTSKSATTSAKTTTGKKATSSRSRSRKTASRASSGTAKPAADSKATRSSESQSTASDAAPTRRRATTAPKTTAAAKATTTSKAATADEKPTTSRKTRARRTKTAAPKAMPETPEQPAAKTPTARRGRRGAGVSVQAARRRRKPTEPSSEPGEEKA